MGLPAHIHPPSIPVLLPADDVDVCGWCDVASQHRAWDSDPDKDEFITASEDERT